MEIKTTFEISENPDNWDEDIEWVRVDDVKAMKNKLKNKAYEISTYHKGGILRGYDVVEWKDIENVLDELSLSGVGVKKGAGVLPLNAPADTKHIGNKGTLLATASDGVDNEHPPDIKCGGV